MNFQQFILEAYGQDYQKDFSKLKLSNQEKSQSHLFSTPQDLKPQDTKITYKTLRGELKQHQKPSRSITAFNDALFKKVVSGKLAELFVVFEFECYVPLDLVSSEEKLKLSSRFDIKEANTYFAMTGVMIRLKDNNNVQKWITNFVEENKEQLASDFELIQNYIKEKKYHLIDNIFKKRGIFSKDEFLYNLYLKDTLNPYTFENFIKICKPALLPGFKIVKNVDNQEVIVSVGEKSEQICYNEIKDMLLTQFKKTLFKNNEIDIKPPKTTIDQTHWTLTEDSSLRDMDNELIPVELVSPRINYKDVNKALADIYRVLTDLKVTTTSETGLHVNIGFYNDQELDLIKLVILSSDNEDLKDYNRLTNTYCQSQMNYLIQSEYPENKFNELTRILDNQTTSFYRIFKEEKYMDVNVKKWVSTYPGYKPLIEFRALGGANYFSSKYEQTIRYIQKYCALMVIATDPDLYKDQYRNKLQIIKEKLSEKIANKQLENINYILELLDSRTRKKYVNTYEIKDLLSLYEFSDITSIPNPNEDTINYLTTIKNSEKIKAMILSVIDGLDSNPFLIWLKKELT